MFSETSHSKYKKNSLINVAGIVMGFGLVLLRSSLPGLAIEIALFALSLIILVRAADVFTDMAVIVGERLGLSKLNTGILIIAIGTSAPELFSSISAAIQNQPEMVVGNVIGTVIANCLLGVGIAAVVSKNALDVHREVLSTQMTIFLVAILLHQSVDLQGFSPGRITNQRQSILGAGIDTDPAAHTDLLIDSQFLFQVDRCKLAHRHAVAAAYTFLFIESADKTG